jgi:teichuronic acid biosynthesis glycosyltransferase TuaC
MITSEWPGPGVRCTSVFVKRQAEFLRAAGASIDVFPFFGDKNPYNYFLAWRRIWPALRSGRYDLVHAQFGQSGLLALPKQLPLVVTFRGSDLLGIVDDADGRYTRRGRLLQSASRYVARRADAVILVAEHMRAGIGTRAPIHVIPSGLDFDLFRPLPRAEARRQLGLDPNERLVLFVGRVDQARKRHSLAREAVDRLRPTMPATLITAFGMEHAKIPVYMSACDALILTSMHEGSPNVVKEALACDLPVVSVSVGDVPERLRGVEGCEITDDDPDALAAALGRVLRRGGRVEGRRAVAHLDERLLTQQVMSVYRSVLSP